MVVVAVVVVLVIAFIVAAVMVGGESRRLGTARFQPVYRLEEAVAEVADDLAFEMAAVLTHDEVRSLLRWHLNSLQFDPDSVLRPMTGTEHDDDGEDEVVTSDHDATSAVYRRARSHALEVTRPQVEAVVHAHLDYLRRIGAVQEIGDS